MPFSESFGHKLGYGECSNPRFLNEAKIAIKKHNHQGVIHKLPTVNTEDISTDKTIRTKQSLFTRFSLFRLFRNLPLWFKYIYSWSNQLKLYYVKTNVIHSHCYYYRTYIAYSFLCFILGRNHLFITWGERLDLFTLFFHFINTFVGHVLLKLCH